MSLRDHKNTLLSKGKVYSETGSGKSLYKSFVVVVSYLNKRPGLCLKEEKQAMDSKCHSSMLEEG